MDKKTQNYALIGVGVVAAGTTGFIIYKNVKKKSEEKAAAKAVTTGGNKALGINIPVIAQQLGLDLGYGYSAWNVFQRSTENDQKAKELVLKVPKPYIPALAKAYAAVPATKGRNLQMDLQKVLDDWDDVAYLFSK